jgi:hypothetical protein
MLARFARPNAWAWSALIVFWLLVPFEPSKLDPPIAAVISFLRIFVTPLLMVISLVAWLYVLTHRGVVLKKEHEVESLLSRYGEKTVLVVLAAILGAVAKTIADRYIGK